MLRTDLATVGESQQDALEQAKQMLGETENAAPRAALQTAIKAMESAEKSLQAAKKIGRSSGCRRRRAGRLPGRCSTGPA